MSRQLRSFLAVAQLDLAEVLRSRWLLFCVVVYAILAIVFLMVGMRESTVFGFTGTGRVLCVVCTRFAGASPIDGAGRDRSGRQQGTR